MHSIDTNVIAKTPRNLQGYDSRVMGWTVSRAKTAGLDVARGVHYGLGMNTKRIGPRMLEAAAYVSRNPGCAILPVAEFVGPHRSRNYGYRTVHRAIAAGLIVATVVRGRYVLTAP